MREIITHQEHANRSHSCDTPEGRRELPPEYHDVIAQADFTSGMSDFVFYRFRYITTEREPQYPKGKYDYTLREADLTEVGRQIHAMLTDSVIIDGACGNPELEGFHEPAFGIRTLARAFDARRYIGIDKFNVTPHVGYSTGTYTETFYKEDLLSFLARYTPTGEKTCITICGLEPSNFTGTEIEVSYAEYVKKEIDRILSSHPDSSFFMTRGTYSQLRMDDNTLLEKIIDTPEFISYSLKKSV